MPRIFKLPRASKVNITISKNTGERAPKHRVYYHLLATTDVYAPSTTKINLDRCIIVPPSPLAFDNIELRRSLIAKKTKIRAPSGKTFRYSILLINKSCPRKTCLCPQDTLARYIRVHI